MSLFTKAITEITHDDVNAFCNEGIEEGIRVEYKREIENNRKIAKEIAAFANTYGGILLIGVDEEDRKPKVPICGIDYDDGLHEKISSIALKGIYPPVFPEVQVCKLNDDVAKAVIVVRTAESNDTPHRVDQDTKAYMRIASQSEPVLAKSGDIEFLQNRRKKAIEINERLVKRAHERFEVKYGVAATRSISIIPLYPHKELIGTGELLGVIFESRVPYSGSSFPRPWDPITLKDSVLYSRSFALDPSEFQRRIHTEISSFGLVFHKENLVEDDSSATNKIVARNSLERIVVALQFALKLFEKLGFWGVIQVEVLYENIRGRSLSANEDYVNEFDNNIRIVKETTVHDLVDNFDEIVLVLFSELLWSFNAESLANNRSWLLSQIEICRRGD